MPTMRRVIVIATFLAVVLPAATFPALAQEPVDGAAPPTVAPDARWLPWMGCWRLWEEQFEQAPDGSELPDRMVVCLTADPDGARMTARAGDEVLVERTLAADGVRREVSDGECRGWERRDWSADGRRIYTSAEIRCGDDVAPVARSGMSLLSNPTTWVDVQVVNVEGQQHLEIRRYNPAPDTASSTGSAAAFDDIRQARRVSSAPPGLAAVREAAAKADPRVVEAMLTETEPRLQIDRDTLVELDDAGIDTGVIDLLVALAYPERFVVERRRSGRSGGGWSSTGGGFAYDPFSYGSAYPYYLTPFGYYGYMRYGGPYGGAFSPYYGYPTFGGVNPFIRLGDGDAAPRGGAVNGVGYTRVRERTAVANLGTAVPAGTTGGSSTARRRGGGSTPNVGSSSGGGGATRGGYSGRSGGSSSSSPPRGGSSSSGGGGRTAVPRR